MLTKTRATVVDLYCVPENGNVGFIVNLPNRDSFSPDAAFYTGKRAGTLVVWDVDLLSPDVVRVYRAIDPDTPTAYRRGERAEAEPAAPGWSIAVDDLFA